MERSLRLNFARVFCVIGIVLIAAFSFGAEGMGLPARLPENAAEKGMGLLPAGLPEKAIKKDMGRMAVQPENGVDMPAGLLEKAVEKGEVLVIVGLLLPIGDYVPEGVLADVGAIDFQRKAISDARNEFLNEVMAQSYASWESLPLVALKADAATLKRLANSPYVLSITEDSPKKANLASTTEHIGAVATWAAGFGGMGWSVVILDTGIDADHPFFGGRVVHEACWSNAGGSGKGVTLCPGGGNSQTGLGSADALTAQCMNGGNSICDHGSHVAGIAAGQNNPLVPPAPGYNGVAPEANIIAIQVFTRFNSDSDCDGPGTAPCVGTYPSDQLSALNYVNNTLRFHWNIASINMSIGGDMFTAACDGDSLKPAIDNLLSNGIPTVISSGNDGWTNALSSPGCISTAVTVGAVDDINDGVIYNMHSVVDLLAVGARVDSSVPDDVYDNKWGTSMAAPQVTGAFAMLRSIDPSLSVAEILDLLKNTGVLVRDERNPNPAGADAGHVKPRIQLDQAAASLTQADLRVFKDCKPDQPMMVGEQGNCTITVENLGPDPALGITVLDEYISNGIFKFDLVATTEGTLSMTSNPQVEAGNVLCELDSLRRGERVTIRVRISADEPQDIDDRVTVSSITPDPDAGNNVAEDGVTVKEAADLEVFKDCKPDEPLLAGEVATCTITVKNWGPSTAKNVTLKDTHLSDGTFDFGTVVSSSGSCTTTPNPQVRSGLVNCDIGDLAPGAEATVSIDLLPLEAMNINDNAVASSDTFDPDTGNNSARDTVGVKAVADLAVTKIAQPNPVIAGTQLTYDLTVVNNGPSTAVNVVIEDVLPAGVTIQSVMSSGGSCNTGVPGDGSLPTKCTFDSLAPGASETMKVVVTVQPQILGILANNVKVYSDVLDTDNSNNLATVATTVEASADLSVAKIDDPDPVLAGEKIVYDVTIKNVGPSTAVDVMLTDTLPAEVSFVSSTIFNGSGTCVLLPASNKVKCDLNDLNPGQFVTVFIEVLVDPSVPHGTTITNSATVSSATPDPNGANNLDTEDTEVQAEANLIITKNASYLTDNPAPRITYTLLFSNAGPSDAQNVVVVDHLPLTPHQIVYVMDSGNGACAYDDVTHQVSCDFGTLPAGQAMSVDIVVDARGSVEIITNIGTVSTSTTDPDLSNNRAVKEIRVKGGPGN